MNCYLSNSIQFYRKMTFVPPFKLLKDIEFFEYLGYKDAFSVITIFNITELLYPPDYHKTVYTSFIKQLDIYEKVHIKQIIENKKAASYEDFIYLIIKNDRVQLFEKYLENTPKYIPYAYHTNIYIRYKYSPNLFLDDIEKMLEDGVVVPTALIYIKYRAISMEYLATDEFVHYITFILFLLILYQRHGITSTMDKRIPQDYRKYMVGFPFSMLFHDAMNSNMKLILYYLLTEDYIHTNLRFIKKPSYINSIINALIKKSVYTLRYEP